MVLFRAKVFRSYFQKLLDQDRIRAAIQFQYSGIHGPVPIGPGPGPKINKISDQLGPWIPTCIWITTFLGQII